jgi:hypothetical protein
VAWRWRGSRMAWWSTLVTPFVVPMAKLMGATLRPD